MSHEAIRLAGYLEGRIATMRETAGEIDDSQLELYWIFIHGLVTAGLEAESGTVLWTYDAGPEPPPAKGFNMQIQLRAMGVQPKDDATDRWAATTGRPRRAPSAQGSLNHTAAEACAGEPDFASDRSGTWIRARSA